MWCSTRSSDPVRLEPQQHPLAADSSALTFQVGIWPWLKRGLEKRSVGYRPKVDSRSSVKAMLTPMARDQLLRRSFHAGGQPAHAQVGGGSRYPWVTAGDRSFPLVLARMWHDAR